MRLRLPFQTVQVSPLAKVLASLPPDAVEAVHTRARNAIGPYETPSGLEFPGVSLLATGHRA